MKRIAALIDTLTGKIFPKKEILNMQVGFEEYVTALDILFTNIFELIRNDIEIANF